MIFLLYMLLMFSLRLVKLINKMIFERIARDRSKKSENSSVD